MATLARTDAILARLRTGLTSSSELERALGVSQASISRDLRQLIEEKSVLRIGSRRGAVYAYRREVDLAGSQWPLRRVDPKGGIHELGTLYSLSADQYYFVPVEEGATGLLEPSTTMGLPYFLQDQRPGGFLGRAVPRRYPDLSLPQRVVDWTDDHYLRYLTQRGVDAVSDLILGDEAFNRYLAGLRHRESIESGQRDTRYPQIATEVMEGGLPGSSAHGEHPKFATLLKDGKTWRSVIVKFSPTLTSEVGRRWGDLLIAEHHAHEVLSGAGLAACRSRIFEIANRIYLEVDRFDREGHDGRIGVVSLWAIDTARYGQLDTWIEAATRLQRDGLIDSATLEQVRFAAIFGALIANTDRHFGNLAFYDRYDGKFSLAPIYDMLPMLFAPEHDQLFARVFEPPDPSTDTLRAYGRARELAERYWGTLTQDQRISEGFRRVCAGCLAALEALPRTGAFAQARS